MALFVETVINGAAIGAIYALMAMGFVVTYQTMRVPNFALSEMVLLAGGVSALASSALGLSIPLAMLVGFAAMTLWLGAFSAVVFARIARSREATLLLVMLGFGTFMQGCFAFIAPQLSRFVQLPFPRDTLILWGMYIYPDEILTGLVALAAAAAVGALFRWTRVGLALRALADDPAAAMAMGVHSRRYFQVAWAVTAGITVVAGVLWIDVRGPGFGFTNVGLKVLPIVIIGGLDSMGGTVVGGLLIGVLENLVATYLDPLAGTSISQIAALTILVLVMLFRPYGLFGSPSVDRL